MQDFIALKVAAKEQPVKSDFEEFFKSALEDQYNVSTSWPDFKCAHPLETELDPTCKECQERGIYVFY